MRRSLTAPMAPEQAAVHIVDNEPGVTDHPDDYVG